MFFNVLSFLLLRLCTVSSAQDIRLVGGSNSSEGRVEVYIDGQWGTICDDFWDLNDATVVCHQLGFKEASLAAREASFGPGSGPIHLDDVRCIEDEISITECHYVSNSDCRHNEDAGVRCVPYETGYVQLSDGNQTAGRIQLYFDGRWTTICNDQNWNLQSSVVVCRQLGYREAYKTIGTMSYIRNNEYISTTAIYCYGNETMLSGCPRMAIGDCNTNSDAGVSCHGLPEGKTDIRLSGGNETAGRIEIYENNEWGTVCDDSWDLKDGAVVCRQLGFKSAFSVIGSKIYGEGEGPIYFDNVDCRGNEVSLHDCIHSREHDCKHLNDAGVSCVPFERGDVRLVDGDEVTGRIEIYLNESWGSICFINWDLNDANVVCRQLGFESAVIATSYVSFTNEQEIFTLNNIACVGTELSLMECSRGSQNDCVHNVYAGVICTARSYAPGDLRLSDGNQTAGRVEVFYDNEWGTVCDDDWDINDARVVCHQLGFKTAYRAFTDAAFGVGRGPIHFDDVGCRGYELSLLECSKSRNQHCEHREDAGVSCKSFVTILTGRWIIHNYQLT